jgi:hypothetical protein
LPADGVPSMREIEHAAARIGVEVGALGDKIKQIGLTETADEFAQAWLTLERASADMSVAAQAGAEEMQGYIDQALKYGFSLPESLKGAAQQMKELGLISGDLEQINWAKPLTDSVQDLVAALRDLIATMGGIAPAAQGAAAGMPHLGGPSRGRDPELDPWIGEGGSAEFGGYMANGGDYLVTRPTVFVAGEAGPERATFTPAGRGGFGGGAMHITLMMPDGDVLLRQTVRSGKRSGWIR